MSQFAQAHTDGSNGADTLQPPFPLTRLPVEIQLRIITCCVISKTPIVNLVTKDWQWYEEEKKSYSRAQHHLTLNILRTCRTYYDEGWEYFWRENVFLYTSPEALAKAMDWSRHSTRIFSLNILRRLSVRCTVSTFARQWETASDAMIYLLAGCLQDCWPFEFFDRLQNGFVVPEIPSASDFPRFFTGNQDILQIVKASRSCKSQRIACPISAAVAKAVGRVTMAQPRVWILQDQNKALSLQDSQRTTSVGWRLLYCDQC